MIGRICVFFVLSAKPCSVRKCGGRANQRSARPRWTMTIDHRIGLLLFPNITQLDLAGPYEVFSRMPRTSVHLVWKDTEPSRSEWGVQLRPDTSFEQCPG